MALQLPLYTTDNTFASYLDRLLVKSLGIQAGVVESEDYKVSAGAGLQVNLKAGKAFVEQTKAVEESNNSFFNGLYGCFSSTESSPSNNVEVSAVNPQIAQIILRVYDVEEQEISGQSRFQIEWLNGTPTAEAKESKMKEGIYEGAATLPQSSLRLARVLVPKNATKSSEYYIEDARLFASGSSLNVSQKELKKSIISSEQSRESTTFGLLETPDIVEVTMPKDGLIAVIYHATVTSSVASEGSAALFVGENQFKINAPEPKEQEVIISGTTANIIGTFGGGTEKEGLYGYGAAYKGDVSTGQSASAPIMLFAETGNYKISVKFKAKSGKVTAKNRKLWAWAII